MTVAHSTFWPECSCCWLLGYFVDDERPNEWAQRMTSWDPLCPVHPYRPKDFTPRVPAPGLAGDYTVAPSVP